jgi:hypothetical protein
LGVYLRCLARDRPKNWLRWLPWAEYCYNTSYQSALKTTPFEAVYGRAPPPLLSYQSRISKVATVDRQLQERDLFLSEIRDRLLHAQYGQHRDIEFQVGDWVWLRLQPLCCYFYCSVEDFQAIPMILWPLSGDRVHW